MASRSDSLVRMPVAEEEEEGRTAEAAPEEFLNRFVRVVAFLERAGNGFGTLAFTWATVVLLGGFSTMLKSSDFICATFLVFLEAARIFSQNTRMEYQFFFRTRDAFRFPRMNRLFRIICIIDVLVFLTAKYKNGVALVVFGPRWNAAVAAASQHFKVNSAAVSIMQTIQFQILAVTIYLFIIVKLLSPVALNLFWNPRRRAELVWSPLFAILLLGPCLYLETAIPKGKLHMPRIFFIPLLAAALVVTISKLKFRRITMLVNSPTGRKVLCMRPAILIILMFAAIVILWNISENPGYFMAIFLFYALVIESFGNLQIPAACARVVLGLLALVKIQYGKSNFATGTSEDTQKNFILSRRLFYIMVLLEGALCIVACIAEIFSSIPRKLLVHRSGLRNWWGEKCIDMYYSYIFEQYIARGVLAPRIMQLTSFAMDLTNSTSDGNQLCGVRMLHSFLQREPSKTLLLSRLSTSTKTVHTLINILGWASPEDAVIRLYSAKVINDLAKTLQVDAIHGSMQNISSLLGTDNRLERQNPLLYTYDSQDGRRDTILDTGDNQEHRQDPSLHTSNRENSRILGCWQWMKKYCSIQETCTDQYLLPVLGMSILEMLADCDPGNCVEISRTADLISKIIGYTSKTQEKILKESSLKLMRRLSNTGGEIGVTLRKKMTEHPFLLKNLADVLDDIEGTQELRKLATEILRNLAVDRNTRQEIGRIGEITSRLLHAFLAWHAPSSDRSLQIISGQALAFSAMESVNNCSVMLKEPGYAFIQKLTAMIQDDRYNRYVAASILRNLCLHARPKLSNSDLAELSHFVRKVLEIIIETEEAGEIDILISLSSQICIFLPEEFSRELEHGQVQDRFVKKLVKALNANMKPTAHFPGIRRVIMEQVICMMDLHNSSRYAKKLSECWMMEALLMVEETPSTVENYMLFFGNAGVMEHDIPLSSLVARAKEELMRRVP